MRTSRAGLASCPLDWTRPSSQARAARARVLKNRPAQSHLSMRTEGMKVLSYKICFPVPPFSCTTAELLFPANTEHTASLLLTLPRQLPTLPVAVTQQISDSRPTDRL